MRKLIAFLLAVSTTAFADGPAAPQNGLTPFIPLIFIFVIFYFLILRPQQRKAKQHDKFLSELKRSDMVITASGIIGVIRTINDKFVTLEVDEGVVLKVLKTQIADSAKSLVDEKSKATIAQLQEEKK